ncbi:MAG: PAS domain S-box protein [Myxococcales bacterium]|nr:PAS domain S-box protein [Myxococcales bacterium]
MPRLGTARRRLLAAPGSDSPLEFATLAIHELGACGLGPVLLEVGELRQPADAAAIVPGDDVVSLPLPSHGVAGALTIAGVPPSDEVQAALRELRDVIALGLRARVPVGTTPDGFRAVFEEAGIGMAMVDPTSGRFLTVNDQLCETLGRTRAQLLALGWSDVTPAEDIASIHAFLAPIVAGTARTLTRELRYHHPGGEQRWARLTVTRLDAPRPPRLFGLLEDVTSARAAIDALRASEERLATMFALAPIGIAEGDVIARRMTRVNAQLCAITGYTAEELCSISVVDQLTHPDDRAELEVAMRRLLKGELRSHRGERRYVHKDGHTVWVSVTLCLTRDPAGQLTRTLAIIEDISERRAREATLQVYTSALLAAANAIMITDPQGTIMACNPAMTTLTGYDAEELIGCHPRLFRSGRQSAEFYRALWDTVLSGQVWHGELVNRRKDGGLYTEDMTITPVRDDAGAVTHLVAIKQDATARGETEQALRASEARYRTLVDNLEDVVFTLDAALQLTFVSRAVESFGYTADELLGQPVLERLFPFDHPAALALIADGAERPPRELRAVDASGRARPVRVVLRPIRAGGGLVGVTGVLVDLTARREIEEQLRAAQKMEAVGRLAGGVAHDFNNLLSVIMSYTDLAIADLHQEDPLSADLKEVQAAARRAEGLTRQLLAFSRKQVLSPEPCDLYDLVTGIARLLQRLIGEDVKLVIERDHPSAQTLVDRGQIEQVIMNLAVNARDAMPDGGRVTIATTAVDLDAPTAHALELAPGPYLELSVADTGTGMDEAVRARVFEPFFTTKGVGKGTGLGLSMVYGIVRQSGGAITVDSEPGHGARFRIYLPIHTGADADEPARPAPRVPRGQGAVLVIEDEVALRNVIRRVLTNAGYEVALAADAFEARTQARLLGDRLRLILSDVILPGPNGPTLVDELRQGNPDIAVIFMSGYTDDALARLGVLEREFLRKPFDLKLLTARVGDALVRASPATPA